LHKYAAEIAEQKETAASAQEKHNQLVEELLTKHSKDTEATKAEIGTSSTDRPSLSLQTPRFMSVLL